MPRRRSTASELRASGSWRAERRAATEVVLAPLDRIDAPPGFLDDERVRAAWDLVVPEVLAAGLATSADVGTVLLLVESLALYRYAWREAMARPLESVRGQRAPAILVAHNALSRVMALSDRLGLSPAARTHLERPPAPAGADEMDEYRDGQGD